MKIGFQCICGEYVEFDSKDTSPEHAAETLVKHASMHQHCRPLHAVMSKPAERKIIGYEACTGSCAEELATNVDRKMDMVDLDGVTPMNWVPYGNPGSSTYGSGSVEYFQMMVRYK